jgi:hypothetical protein
MEHEEDHALPLVEAHLGPDGWAAFGKAAGKSEGLRGAAELFPWMLDGAPADTKQAGTRHAARARPLPLPGCVASRLRPHPALGFRDNLTRIQE